MKGVEGIDFVTCLEPDCGRQFRMITEQHLKRSHNITGEEYLKKYPGALLSCLQRGQGISNTHKCRRAFRDFVKLNQLHPFCDCGCGGRVVKEENRYIHGHNRQGQQGWSSGLTEETNQILAERARNMRGRSKETHQYIADHAKIMAGRTKETHSGVAAQSAKMRNRTKHTHPGPAASSEKMLAHWADPEWVANHTGPWGPETKRHLALKHQAQDILISLGFAVVTENWLTANGSLYRVDIYTTRGDRTVIVEVGDCCEEKLTNLRKHYGIHNVFTVPYGDEEAALIGLEKMCFDKC